MDLYEIEKIVSTGESETVEFKKSIAQPARLGETLCALLNTSGGYLFVGVGSDGKLLGQHVTDNTLREIAHMLSKIDPPDMVEMNRTRFKDGKELLVLAARPVKMYRPFTFEGRAYQRVGSTTRLMPQQTYQRLLLEKTHTNHRWESEPAVGYKIANLDEKEILRTVRLGVQAGRLPENVGENIPEPALGIVSKYYV
jgi:ATP-dependent DNA helicase RecG